MLTAKYRTGFPSLLKAASTAEACRACEPLLGICQVGRHNLRSRFFHIARHHIRTALSRWQKNNPGHTRNPSPHRPTCLGRCSSFQRENIKINTCSCAGLARSHYGAFGPPCTSYAQEEKSPPMLVEVELGSFAGPMEQKKQVSEKEPKNPKRHAMLYPFSAVCCHVRRMS